MSFLNKIMSVFKLSKNRQKKDFEERARKFMAKLQVLMQEEKVGVRPMIGKYGPDIELFDMSQNQKNQNQP